MFKIIHFVQNLSLDITVGAVISSLFIARIMQVKVSCNMMLGLATAIWLIYTFDHLRDAYKTEGLATNPRHAFHQKYFKALVAISILVFLVGVYNLQHLPWSTIEIGLVLLALSGLYFVYLMLSKRAINKEFFAATVYVAGISTAPLSQLEGFKREWLWVIAIFGILAFCNLLVIPFFEELLDKTDNKESIVTRIGRRKVKKLTLGLLTLSLLIVHYYWFESRDMLAYMVLLLMHLTLIILIVLPQKFRIYQLYRIFSDGIFFLPGIYLLQ